MLRSFAVAFLAVTCVAAAPFGAAAAETGGKQKNRIIMQVSDGDSARWNLALSNARNVQAELGKDNVEIEILAYGPGLDMLKLESVAGPKVAEALAAGVKVVACENTMIGQHITRDDMLPDIGYVKTGVVQIMRRQQEGYAYVRP